MAIKTVHVKGFMQRRLCNMLVYWFNNPVENQEQLPLKNEHNNLTNKVYTSTRSEGLRYQYQKTETTKMVIQSVKSELYRLVGEEFDAPINDEVIPIFKYVNYGAIKPHKDLNKMSEKVEFQHLVAVIVLTQKGVDFEGGRFYLNPKAKHSDDGKEVWDDFPEDRIYPDLDCGDIFIFDNREFIHGVETVVLTKEGMQGRYSCSFRTL